MLSATTDLPVALCGLPGSGKSTVGRGLAAALGWHFVDLDERIVEQSGCSIADWFFERGEAAFRAFEAEQLVRALQPRTVIALGGGALGVATSRELLRTHSRLVWLRAEIASLVARLDSREELAARPLLVNADLRTRLGALYTERQTLYASAELQVTTDDRSVDFLVEQLRERLHAPRLLVDLTSARYPIVFAPNEAWFGEELRAVAPSHRYCIITDDHVGKLHGERYAAALAHAHVDLLSVPPGEDSKSWSQAGALLARMADVGCDRHTVVVALGGGVVGDLAGFVASTFMRGVPVVQIPTTVLAQVDSSVGGKTGVNLATAKNLVGTFHQPRLVYVDSSTLSTLSSRDRRAGLAELVKHGLLANETLLGSIDVSADDLAAGDLRPLPHLLRDSCEIKARVVAADEREASTAPDGGRAQLNLGHTVGHALEAWSLRTDEPLRHGEAVALGLVAELELGVRLGHTSQLLLDRTRQLLERLQLPVDYAPRLSVETFGYLLRDKKNRHDRERAQVRFVLLEEIGKPLVVDLPIDKVREALLDRAVHDRGAH